ncbi:hypothetical protein DPX39_070071100 [Trypanosoma brucei equiperdum]|uniref:Uncharacterized protein n=1 Tax=Trypanosoma brucei equiperdum TaxID=630700 RepID=A0A3L6L4J6_9TRYP|nr:hypothetical protein DPX39_070070900 [Trypanosoma brucei equiperdum]RHW71640.1 hypothetical protein DPX39_070071100 [Trypanosoma brucei equiperdum]
MGPPPNRPYESRSRLRHLLPAQRWATETAHVSLPAAWKAMTSSISRCFRAPRRDALSFKSLWSRGQGTQMSSSVLDPRASGDRLVVFFSVCAANSQSFRSRCPLALRLCYLFNFSFPTKIMGEPGHALILLRVPLYFDSVFGLRPYLFGEFYHAATPEGRGSYSERITGLLTLLVPNSGAGVL